MPQPAIFGKCEVVVARSLRLWQTRVFSLCGVTLPAHAVIQCAASPVPHDLRRSFGERWAALVPEMVLMEMMRHSSIETTRRYYKGRNAQRTADEVWRVYERLIYDSPKSGTGSSDQFADQSRSAENK